MSSATTATSAAGRQQLGWRDANVVVTVAETSTARTIVLDVPGWGIHRAGQHVDIRLTAPDGYQATRSYSLSSAPGEPPQITVQLVADGEVSTHLVEVVEAGDRLELRGPLGGYFVWNPTSRPLVLIAGGSGIAPLRSMWRLAGSDDDVTIVASAQSPDRAIFATEVMTGRHRSRWLSTRVTGDGFQHRRIGVDDLRWALEGRRDANVFVCGPTSFVEAVSRQVVELVDDPRTVRTERFG